MRIKTTYQKHVKIVFDFTLPVYDLFVYVCSRPVYLTVQFVLLAPTFAESNCTKILVPNDLQMPVPVAARSKA